MVQYLKRFAIMVRFDSIMKKNQLISSKYFSISNLKPSPRFFLLLLNRNQSMHIVEALVWRATQFQLFNFSERRGKSSEMETNSPIAASGIPAFTDRIFTATVQCEKQHKHRNKWKFVDIRCDGKCFRSPAQLPRSS